jgi:fructosamine-3-kinase
MPDWSAISRAVGSATGETFKFATTAAVAGGCINRTFALHGQNGRRFFVKLNTPGHQPLFAAEAAGLNAIAATRTVRVPAVVCAGNTGTESFLVLEWLALNGRAGSAHLGEQLARLHRHSTAQFGFAENNFIGTTPQDNHWHNNWINFWREQRLGYQLQLAASRGDTQLLTAGEKLLEVLPLFFAGYTPAVSLLHGDLWGGNHGFLADGTPVIFDPAAYYGDRECDLAMTELFGGFDAAFYAAYRAAWPPDPGHRVRKTLYNLYHILNHAHLFGGGYARQAENMMQRLLAEVR